METSIRPKADKLGDIIRVHRERIAELGYQHSNQDITGDECAVFSKRAQSAAKATLFQAGRELASAIIDRMRAPEAVAADKFQAQYWDVGKLDAGQVALHQQLLMQRLKSTTSASAAEALVEGARATTAPKELTMALHLLAGELASHRDKQIAKLSMRARNALTHRLSNEPAYLAAAERQNAAFGDVSYAVSALKHHAKSALGGGEATGIDPRGTPGSLQAVSYYFDNQPSQATHWDPNQVAGSLERNNVPPSLTVRRHEVSPFETGGLLEGGGVLSWDRTPAAAATS